MNKLKKSISILGAAAALSLTVTGLSATPVAPVVEKAHAASLSHCYVTMHGETWCYRSGCTTIEVWFNNCTQGWVRVNRSWYS